MKMTTELLKSSKTLHFRGFQPRFLVPARGEHKTNKVTPILPASAAF
jgi:hypothetical protein